MIALTLVSDRRLISHGDLPALARAAAAAGVDQVQVRERDLGGRLLRALVTSVVEATFGTVTRVLVNGRPDVAAVTGASGVQLPEEGLPVSAVKRGFPSLCLGASCHSVDAARRAEEDGADFVLLGPIFSTPGKERRVLGPRVLEEAARALRIPVHAIGGIDASNAGRAIEAGARGLAAIRFFLDRPPEAAARALRGEGT